MTNFAFQRRYEGPIRAVIVDMAGTVVDYGSCAPAGAFVELFRRNGVEISQAQAREPMGLEKKDHVRMLSQMPIVAARWEEAHGKPCTEEDVDRMYEAFIPLQLEVLPAYCQPIPGAVYTIRELRATGILVGGTTGYNREMMETVLKHAQPQGLELDSAVCASDVPAGWPAPWMIYRTLQELGVYPPDAVVKIGDTVPDIEAGLNAGVWTIGVTKTGNCLGLSQREVESTPADELRDRLAAARTTLQRAGAHYVVDSIGDCAHTIEEINQRLYRHGRP